MAADDTVQGSRASPRCQQPRDLNTRHGRRVGLRLQRLIRDSRLRFPGKSCLGVSDGAVKITLWQRHVSGAGRGSAADHTGLSTRPIPAGDPEEGWETGVESGSGEVQSGGPEDCPFDPRRVERPDCAQSAG